MALARARELTDSVMQAVNNNTAPEHHVNIFPYSGTVLPELIPPSLRLSGVNFDIIA